MIKWKGYNWITRQVWGEIHPKHTFCWYDSSAVKIDSDDSLHLISHKNVRYFPEHSVTSQIGIGLICSENSFQYGHFEIEAKLPSGPIGIWPAFWFSGVESWPPEIDIFEGFGNWKGNYLKFDPLSPLGVWNIRPTLHLGDSELNYSQIKSRQPCFGWKNPSKTYMKYSILWEPDSIKIWYNNRLVKTYRDDNILRWLRKPMYLILNNSVSAKTDPNNCFSDFHITNLKISNL